jgi:hypothetical protein
MAESDWLDARNFEVCVNELDEFVASLRPFPDVVLARALRAHLAALLHALLNQRIWTAEQISKFVRTLERESLRG